MNWPIYWSTILLKPEKGDRVLITMMETDTFPLARAVHAAAVQAGAIAHIEFQSLLLQRDLMLHGREEQFAPSHELQSRGMEWADVYIGLRGASNPHELSGIEEERIMAFRRELGKVSAKRTEQTRWVLVRVPNSSFAQFRPRHASQLSSVYHLSNVVMYVGG